MQQWKQKWRYFEILSNLSGWSINAEDTLLADDEAWARAIESYGSNARQFKGKPFEYRKQLDEIFGGTAATGEYARAGGIQEDDNDTDPGGLIDEVQRPQPPALDVDDSSLGDLVGEDSQQMSTTA